MSDIAIRVEGLGKQYRLGAQQAPYQTLGEQFRKWTSLRSLLRRQSRTEKNPPFWALKDVSFEVKKGEVVGIIGRNGAGKSTLLKILSQITEPTEGTVDLFGRVGSLLEVGTGFHPELTGRENIYLNGAILGMKRLEIARKFDEIVAFAEVEKFIDTAVKHYSSGMYMRLAFAVAAHLEPEILIVDEVLAVGDAEFQKKCLGKMGDVSKEGRTVLIVSHNVGMIQSLCQFLVILQAGKLFASGDTKATLPLYLNVADYSKSYKNESKINSIVCILSATACIVDEDYRNVLALNMRIIATREITVSIDIRLEDSYGSPIGFAPIGSFNQTQTIRLTCGANLIQSKHDISYLATGRYTLSIDVANPTVSYYERAQQCLYIEVNSPPRIGNYRRLDQSWRLGTVEFPYLSHTIESVHHAE